MKKLACLVLAVAMLLSVTTVLADGVSISADYSDGMLTVSTSSTGYFTISVDGNGTARSLTPSASSLTFVWPLEDGYHTVTIESDILGSASQPILVGQAPVEPTEPPVEPTEPPVEPTEPPVNPTEPPVEPTEPPVDPTEPPVDPTEPPVDPTEPPVEPTEPPVEPTEIPTGPLTITASYRNGVISYTVSGLKVPYGELWLDGGATSVSAVNGSSSFNHRLPAGVHTLLVYTANESDSCTFEVEVLMPFISSAECTEVGKLVYTVGNINNPSEIWLEGRATSQAVSEDGTYTLDWELECQKSYTLLLYDATNDLRAYYTFTVDHIAKAVPGKAPTCTETGLTDGEVCALCGEELKAQEEIPALGHDIVEDEAKEPTCTEDGLTAGKHCTRCDDATVAQEVIPALGHTEKVVPGKAATCTAAGLTDGKVCEVCGETVVAQETIPKLGHNYMYYEKVGDTITYRCTRCGDSFTQKDPNVKKNAYGSILKDTNEVYVDYFSEGKGKTLIITADLSKKYTSEIGMYLDDEVLAQFKSEGFTSVEYINGTADIVIDLNAITPTWFETEATIWCYVFSTDPAPAEGILVKVEAQISGTEKVPATAFSGVSLKKSNRTLNITANGNY